MRISQYLSLELFRHKKNLFEAQKKLIGSLLPIYQIKINVHEGFLRMCYQWKRSSTVSILFWASLCMIDVSEFHFWWRALFCRRPSSVSIIAESMLSLRTIFGAPFWIITIWPLRTNFRFSFNTDSQHDINWSIFWADIEIGNWINTSMIFGSVVNAMMSLFSTR